MRRIFTVNRALPVGLGAALTAIALAGVVGAIGQVPTRRLVQVRLAPDRLTAAGVGPGLRAAPGPTLLTVGRTPSLTRSVYV
jgi:hypothetical protein